MIEALAFLPVLMTFAMGLAIAGPTRWIQWSVVFVVASTLIPAAAFYLGQRLPQDGIVVGMIAFGLGPLLPAFYLWLAYRIRRAGGA